MFLVASRKGKVETYSGRLYSGKTLPELEINEYCVILTDICTGIILDANGERRTNDLTPWVFIFNSLKKAKVFAENQVIANNEIQCVIYGYNKQIIEFIPPQKFTFPSGN